MWHTLEVAIPGSSNTFANMLYIIKESSAFSHPDSCIPLLLGFKTTFVDMELITRNKGRWHGIFHCRASWELIWGNLIYNLNNQLISVNIFSWNSIIIVTLFPTCLLNALPLLCLAVHRECFGNIIVKQDIRLFWPLNPLNMIIFHHTKI